MAKKSNKTEHVLKLISKEEDPEGTAGEEILEGQQNPDKSEEAVQVSSAASEEPEDCRRYRSPEDNTVLINIAEQLVMENIQEVMKRMNVCNCPICRNDIAALALNILPQKYITTNTGKQFTQMEIYKKQYETDVLAALTKACVRVKAGPRHG